MKQDTAQLVPENQHINVTGELSFDTVSQLRSQGNKCIDQRETVVFDFHRVTRSDSSALTLLTAWTRYAHQQNKKIKFIQLPQQLADIAALSRLNKILPIEGSKKKQNNKEQSSRDQVV